MKMVDKIKNDMFAPCGMNCMVCYKHLKPQKSCKGCQSNNENKPEHCRKCFIKDCVIEKKNTYCFECGEFPCKQIRNLEKSYIKRYRTSLIENSMTVKNEGIESFMIKEKARWTCEMCGGIISLHDVECSECHTFIENTK